MQKSVHYWTLLHCKLLFCGFIQFTYLWRGVQGYLSWRGLFFLLFYIFTHYLYFLLLLCLYVLQYVIAWPCLSQSLKMLVSLIVEFQYFHFFFLWLYVIFPHHFASCHCTVSEHHRPQSLCILLCFKMLFEQKKKKVLKWM